MQNSHNMQGIIQKSYNMQRNIYRICTTCKRIHMQISHKMQRNIYRIRTTCKEMFRFRLTCKGIYRICTDMPGNRGNTLYRFHTTCKGRYRYHTACKGTVLRSRHLFGPLQLRKSDVPEPTPAPIKLGRLRLHTLTFFILSSGLFVLLDSRYRQY